MKAVVITVSDRVSRGEAEDRSGPAAVAALEAIGFSSDLFVVSDGVAEVEAGLRRALATDADLIVTTGGTGMAPRDTTPEATSNIIDREAPGLSEAMRSATFGARPHGMLSRGVSGIAGATLIINLPGSVTGVTESLEVVAEALPHAVAVMRDRPSDH